jgi:hypothetical protein
MRDIIYKSYAVRIFLRNLSGALLFNGDFHSCPIPDPENHTGSLKKSQFPEKIQGVILPGFHTCSGLSGRPILSRISRLQGNVNEKACFLVVVTLERMRGINACPKLYGRTGIICAYG